MVSVRWMTQSMLAVLGNRSPSAPKHKLALARQYEFARELPSQQYC